MNDVLNELDFMLKIKDKFKAVEREIGEVYDIIIEKYSSISIITIPDNMPVQEIQNMVGEINGI